MVPDSELSSETNSALKVLPNWLRHLQDPATLFYILSPTRGRLKISIFMFGKEDLLPRQGELQLVHSSCDCSVLSPLLTPYCPRQADADAAAALADELHQTLGSQVLQHCQVQGHESRSFMQVVAIDPSLAAYCLHIYHLQAHPVQGPANILWVAMTMSMH